MHDSAPWKTEETIVGLPRLLVLSAFSRFGGCHLSPRPRAKAPVRRGSPGPRRSANRRSPGDRPGRESMRVLPLEPEGTGSEVRCQASDSSTKYDPRLGTFLVHSSTTPRIIDEVEAEVETGARQLLFFSAVTLRILGRRVKGLPGRLRRCLTRRSSSHRAAARTWRIASAPSGLFQNISVPFTR